MTLPYKDIMQILHYIHLKPTDVFIDIGCGKGRMLCCAATFNVKKAIGIEHAPEMSFAAMENAYMLREKKSPIEIYIADAAKFDYEEGTIFYMYNLFNQAIMKNVLERIYESLKRRKRLIKIIYTNPLYEHSLYDCSWLTMYDRWVPGILDSPEDKYNDSAGYKSVEVPVSFWKTKL
jgi:SAM-dependent methyltransferase